MKKKLVVTLCSALAAATALPASALTVDFAGMWKAKGYYGDLSFGKYFKKTDGTYKEYGPDKLVDQRFRTKLTFGVNDYIKVVYLGEVDFQWGDADYTTARNQGGAAGADTVNLETKNVYAEVKIPNTAVTATLGMQGFADNWDWILSANDLAGIKVNAMNVGGVADVTAAWFQLAKGTYTTAGAWSNNDSGTGSMGVNGWDLYALQVALKPPVQNLKAGVDLYYLNAQELATGSVYPALNVAAPKEQLYYLGANASYKLATAMPVTLSGWAAYNFGTMEDSVATGEDVDVSAFALSARAEAAPAPGATVALHVMYFTGDDDKTDDTQNSWQSALGNGEVLPFTKDNLQIFLPDIYGVSSYPAGAAAVGRANQTALYDGNGLFGVTLSGNYVPPTMKNVYVKGGLGWFSAAEDDRTPGNGSKDHKGTNLGTEISVHVGYLIADKFDVSLNGAYAMLGDYYDNTAKSKTGKATDPNNPYVLYWQTAVNF